MANQMDRGLFARASEAGVAVDEGLRQYMLRVYNYMAGGLAITGIIAFTVAQAVAVTNAAGDIVGLSEFGQTLFLSPLKWVVMLAPLGFIFFLGARMQRMSLAAAQTTFWLFAAIMGVSMAMIFLTYTGASVTRVFFIAASVFAGMSIYGYTTKKDLSGWRSFLFMGLFGIIIAMIVNIFMQSSAMHFAISLIGVIVFTGLTAYDTQNIKQIYYADDTAEVSGKKAIMGSLRLYLDFINLFIMLLSLLGQRR